MLDCGVTRRREEDLLPAEIHWEGDAREVLAGFPASIRAEFGYSLWQLQQGRTPNSATRRMQSLGPGIWELKESDQKTWYRVMYLSRVRNVIYVLHCFEKRSHKTDRRDLEIVRERLHRVRQRIRQERTE